MSPALQSWSAALDAAASLAAGGRMRRLMHHPLRYIGAIAYRRLVYPLTGKPLHRRCRTFFGAGMEVALPAGMDLYLLGCKTHDSEVRLARFLLNHLRPGDVVADVGAHFGYFTLLAAALCGERGRVFAFEPGGGNFGILERNTAASLQVEARRLLVGDVDGKREFWEYPVLFSEYNTTNPGAVPAYLKGRKTKLPSITLDAFFGKTGLVPRLVKIDVEGAEWEVLQGMKGLLHGSAPPVVAMEYLPGETHRKAAEALSAWGFSAFVPDARGALEPCSNLEAYMQERGLDSENFVFVK